LSGNVSWFYLVTAGQIVDSTCMCRTTISSYIFLHTIHIRSLMTFEAWLSKLWI